MNKESIYNTSFFDKHLAWSMNSARVIVPEVIEFVKPDTVVDFGCGNGTWLKVIKEIYPNIEVYGLDGDYVNPDQLLISRNEFLPCDLKHKVELNKKYDLVISLEVAEHLPEESADQFVENLVNAGDVILFSAAFPGQGGTNHVNEQLPDYWENKFEKYNYHFFDIVRPKVLEHNSVERWYKQNTFLIVKDKIMQSLELPNPGISHINGKLFERFEYYKKCYEGKGGVKVGFKIFMRSLKARLFNNY